MSECLCRNADHNNGGTIYKVLGENGEACYGGAGQWHLPQGDQPGEWMPPIANLHPCRQGYHLCAGELHLLEWLGPIIYEAEYRGKPVYTRDKIVVSEARLVRKLPWDERTAQLFACDCAARVLPWFEQEHPEDDHPRKAIEVARSFALGQASEEDLKAAKSAARAAARAASGAARAAGLAAAWWGVARDAARVAARAAGLAAACGAAAADARDAEREWQANRLRRYLKKEVEKCC